ncbi:hypothetical protein RB602_13690 [Parasphingorhabdus sp. SCSIO 66989]|uniref:Uncharacterized protein n=2 Tax=Alterisphingorhabdus coralli TaxID=3071408 RepID=A0AA97FCR7_9SPHN|nr:hypothetical protein [Parasphingorhabdus sp. SCSIO 66989]WOE76675.1 hypothetical protein RB602_13690 [Parasphingorhabdus sp. SCSIO 66989]
MEPAHRFGNDERRMHVRAYNHWVMLLGDRSFPSIDDLDLDRLDDFAPNSVLLDFTSGIDNPAISHIGTAVAEESGVADDIGYVADIPGRSLLSRITDHYMEILANQAPIGFEAEFVNQRDVTVLYRGILLPFSSDDDSIDFVLGVINWKTVADQASTDALMLEVEQVLDANADVGFDTPIWPDEDETAHSSIDLPDVAFGHPVAHKAKADIETPAASMGSIPIRRDSLAFSVTASAELLHTEAVDFGLTVDQESEADEFVPADNEPAAPDADAGLEDWLDDARNLALKALQSENRSRAALYRAIGRAYDVSLVAAREPNALAVILDNAGIIQQDRAPMTPIVKLVFGADYDKTRLTEYATALSHAHRQQLSLGALPEYLKSYDGGLKGVVRAERRQRRPVAAVGTDPEQALASAYSSLREAPELPLDSVDPGESEFAVLVARRNAAGRIVIVAALADDKVTDHVVRKVAG